MTEVFANDATVATTGTAGTSSPAAGTLETWPVTACTLPAAASPYWLYIADTAVAGEPEKIQVISCAGPGATSINVIRGADSSTPIAHAAGAVFVQVIARATLTGIAPRAVSPVAFGPLGTSDDTATLQASLNAAGSAGADWWLPPVSGGGCYRTSGLTVNAAGVTALRGSAVLNRNAAPGTLTLTGSVLGPASGSVGVLLSLGTAGGGSGNPHGLRVDGLGFLGTTSGGSAISGMWGLKAVDTQDVSLFMCRSAWCDAPGFSGQPTGGGGAGGAYAFEVSSGSSENARILWCHGYGDGKLAQADSTDGRIAHCQSNGHNIAVALSQSANAGGFAIEENHFSSSSAANHLNIGSGGNSWTYRVVANYFDVCTGAHISCAARGMICTDNYFLAGTSTTVPIQFASALTGLTGSGLDPKATISHNLFDLNGRTSVVALAQFGGITAANFPSDGGGVYGPNTAHNRGAAMPASWKGMFVGSDSTAIAATSSASLYLTQAAVC